MKPLSTLLAEQLSWTNHNPEPEPYILTPEDEEKIIRHAIERAREYFKWRMREKGISENALEAKLAAKNFEEDIDRAELLKRANSIKNHEQWQFTQRAIEREQERKRLSELKARCNAKYFYNLMAWTSENRFGKKLIVNEDNTKMIKAVCFFLSSDERFETELGLSLKKGLVLRGISGLGKTHLIRCVEDNELNPVAVFSMLDIAEEIRTEGEFDIDLKGRKLLYLDDVGTEESTINHYGTKINWFKNFIETYYLKNRPFNQILLSTNNSFAEIEEKYGYRVRSRFKEMFNVLDVTGKDLR